MTNKSPAPEEIRAARIDQGMTLKAAADVVHVTLVAWAKWEAGDRKMHPAFWELFNMKTKKRH